MMMMMMILCEKVACFLSCAGNECERDREIGVRLGTRELRAVSEQREIECFSCSRFHKLKVLLFCFSVTSIASESSWRTSLWSVFVFTCFQFNCFLQDLFVFIMFHFFFWCTVGFGYSLGSRYGWVERIYGEIWGTGGLHCYEGQALFLPPSLHKTQLLT